MFEWEEINNDKWITVHPHGEDSKGQPLLVKDGETNKEAIERKFGDEKEEDKPTTTKKESSSLEKTFSDYIDSRMGLNEMTKAIHHKYRGYYIVDKSKLSKNYLHNLKVDDSIEILDKYSSKGQLWHEIVYSFDGDTGIAIKIPDEKKMKHVLKSIDEKQNAKDWAKVYTGKNAMYQGIATYQNESVLLTNETLKEYINDLKGKPVLINHKSGVCPENMDDDAVGYVTEAYYNSETGNFDCKFIIKDDEAKELIKQGYSVSTAYIPTEYGAGGSYINTPYDKEVKGLKFTHLALVPDPRYEEAKIYENSKTATEEKENCKMEKIEVEQGFLTSLFNLVGEKFNACKKNEADEEKTDKRKLIDEVGGILKGKVDEEVWRTIIGKIEKVAYTGSEASEKDNEAEDDKKEDLKEAIEKEEEEKENSKHFEKMHELLNSRKAQDDKIEVYTQAKGLERGKQIYG